MNMQINIKIKNLALLFSLGLLVFSCKKSFEEPAPTGAAPVIANTTIAALKGIYTTSGTTIPITSDVIIGGIVVMDDKSGNFYQQIAIQDETGGILLRLAGNNLWTTYPVGRKIFVKMKGLFLGDYGRMIQVGGGVDEVGGGVTLLARNLQDEHIIMGPLSQPIQPKIVSVNQLTTDLQDPYVNTLVKLQNFEFASADLNKKYAEPSASGNRTIQGCISPTTNRLTLRTSNFANFSTFALPQGNGDILGIYSVFNNTKQFTIRDTTDVMFNGPRCSASTGITGPAINLGTVSPFIIDFNSISSGLPQGVYLSTNSSATALGSAMDLITSKAAWNVTSAGFRNFASATTLTSASTVSEQDASANRALGVRQTSTVDIGGDPGAAFIFQLANTTGKNNLKLDFQLQSLDAGSARVTTWAVDYGIGDIPSSFSSIVATGNVTTGGSSWSNQAVSVNFPAVLNNQSQKIWIRIVALTPTTGTGNRASSAIDDVKFSWN
jgi:hypothetical protein